MNILRKDYISEHAVQKFTVKSDFGIELLIYCFYLNAHTLKKVTITKDFLIQLIDYFDVKLNTDLVSLYQLRKYVQAINETLVKSS